MGTSECSLGFPQKWKLLEIEENCATSFHIGTCETFAKICTQCDETKNWETHEEEKWKLIQIWKKRFTYVHNSPAMQANHLAHWLKYANSVQENCEAALCF